MPVSSSPRVIGILSPGDMGHAIARELGAHGMDVIACLAGRSERTRALAGRAGMREVATMARLVEEADVILSILVPAQAESAAADVAREIQSRAATTHFVDCNAVSPQTVANIGETIMSTGSMFSDGSIIGLPPGPHATPRLYVSGPVAERLQVLDGMGINVCVMGPDVGQASAIKMCYAAVTKGSFALYFAMAMAAERMGLLEQLLAEFEFSQPHIFQQLQSILPRLPAKAWRWVAEMEQIADAFAAVGVTPDFHRTAAELYELISRTSIGRETPETIDERRTFQQTITLLARETPRRPPSA